MAVAELADRRIGGIAVLALLSLDAQALRSRLADIAGKLDVQLLERPELPQDRVEDLPRLRERAHHDRVSDVFVRDRGNPIELLSFRPLRVVQPGRCARVGESETSFHVWEDDLERLP